MSDTGKIIPFGNPADHYFSRAFSKHSSGDYLESLVLFRKALETDPYNTEYRLNYAAALSQVGRFVDSNTELIAMFRNGDVVAESFFWLGSNFMSMSDYEKAEECLGKYLQIDPEGLYADQAGVCLDWIYQINGSATEDNNQFSEGLSAYSSGDYKTAIRKLEHAAKEDIPERNCLVMSYFRDGQMIKALAGALRVLKDYPDNVTALCNIIDIYIFLGKPDMAEIYIKKLKHGVFSSAEEGDRALSVLIELKRHSDILDTVLRLLEINPYESKKLFVAGVASNNLGQYGNAQKYFETMTKLNPKNTVAGYFFRYMQKVTGGEYNPKTLDYTYMIPQKIINGYMSEIIVFLKKEPGERERILMENSRFRNIFIWGLFNLGPRMQVQIADCLARIGGEAYERVLRDYLLYPDEHEDAKKQIMAVMSVNGMENPFMVYLGGKLVEARLDMPGKKKNK